MPDSAIAMIDGQGTVVGWTSTAQQLVGYAAGEVVGRPVWFVLPFLQNALQAWATSEQHHARGGWSGTATIRHRVGHTLHVTLRVSLLWGRDGEVHWLLSGTDIAALSAVDIAGSVRESLLTRTPIGIAVRDLELRCAWVNDVSELQDGIPRDKRLGRRLPDSLPSLESEALEAVMRQVLSSGQTAVHEYRAWPPADQRREHAFAASFFCLSDADGRPLGVCSMSVDVTGNRWARERLAILSEASTRIGSTLDVMQTSGDVAGLFDYCRRTGRHTTLRSGGTSLNGQSQSDDILIDVRHNWNGMTVEDDGARLRARPGTILSHANAVLARYGRRLGPDPASADVATIGGVVANNAGGMRCKLSRNAYHCVSGITFVLPSGTTIDTEADDAESELRRAEPELADGLLTLRAEILADEKLVERIKHKYTIRNTTGYALNAFLDAETPLEIFRRLLVGSEATLAFMAEVVIDTLPNPGTTTVTWISTESVDAAARLVPALVGLGAEAVELMMAPALTEAAKAFPGAPSYWRTLDPKAAALLVEFRGEADALDEAEQSVHELLADITLLHPIEFTRDEELIEFNWRVREGLLGIVGHLRPEGSAVVNEDVCFPPARIAEGAHDLQQLLGKHGFLPGVAGHAAYGNLHFTLTPMLSEEADKERYGAFMSDLVDLIIGKYDGSLKAEHGTGRNMAPFVEREWGAQAIDIMRRLKRLADPHGVLGPDVILTNDEGIHLKHFKSTPKIEQVANLCIECGFCEATCPSRNVTATPRQRIALRREMARQPEDSPVLAQLQAEYEYDAVETCAADGICAIPCPLQINTGDLMKGFRRAESTAAHERAGLAAAKHWGRIERLARKAMAGVDGVQSHIGVQVLTDLTDAARAVASSDVIPSVPGPMPHPAPAHLPHTERESARAVYFPACINRIFGPDPGKPTTPSLPEAFVALSARAGKPLWIPDDVRGLCCSTPWASKGLAEGHRWMAEAICDALWRWSDHGSLPVVVDAASCTHGLLDDVAKHVDDSRRAQMDNMSIRDSISWCRDLLPLLSVNHKLETVALHPTCSTTHLGLNKDLEAVASFLADTTVVPVDTLLRHRGRPWSAPSGVGGLRDTG